MIYLDHAATSPLLPSVLKEMEAIQRQIFGNPSSLYTPAYEARRILHISRATLANAINAQVDEIVFTSGGTESNNLAIFGAARASKRGKHLIVGATEHHSVLYAARALISEGFHVTELACDANGVYSPEALRAAIRPDTALVSLHLANNETGVLEPIAELGALTRERRIVLHCDAVAAFGQVPIDVCALRIDLLSASAHKLGGPKGTGFLYARNEIPLVPLFFGGSQERALRPGTENVPAIAGFAKALENLPPQADSFARDLLESLLLAAIPGARVNGAGAKRLPHLLSITFPGASGERMLAALSKQEIYAATRAACASGERTPSHVLTSMGLSRAEADATIRFSTGISSKLSDMRITSNAIDFAYHNENRTSNTQLNN
jgi:cysteine desulfurase